MHEGVPSNEMHHQLQLKKTKVMLYIFAINIAAKVFYVLTRQRDYFVLEVDVLYGWQSI